MNKQDVIAFFDGCAHGWDAKTAKNDAVVGKILANARIGPGMRVLDVACGTGVLFSSYLAVDVSTVTAIDISPEMARIAAEKWAAEPRIKVICGDVEEWRFSDLFDAIMIYNAFPHFPCPERLIARLAALLKPGGTLTVAHGASRETIDAHHRGSAGRVSIGLLTAEELRQMFARYLSVETVISDDTMYQVTGVKP